MKKLVVLIAALTFAGVTMAQEPVKKAEVKKETTHKCCEDKKAAAAHKCTGEHKHDANHKCTGEHKHDAAHKCSGTCKGAKKDGKQVKAVDAKKCCSDKKAEAHKCTGKCDHHKKAEVKK